VTRRDCQELATLRLKEARFLLGAQCWEGAYYLAGYAAECALKACIARQTLRYEFPDKKRVNDSHTHDLEKLVSVAGLWEALLLARSQSSDFDANWIIVSDWWELSRYERPVQADAENLLRALAAPRHGVMQWLKRFW
jgi:HEPN domain-containing protein